MVGLDKALHQPGAIPVLGFEILAQAAQGHPQYARGQIVAADLRPDQKATHANHPVQVLPARGHVPANPSVPIRKLQRRGSEPQPAKPTMLRADQISHLRPHQRPGALRVFAQHHLVPHPHVIDGVHLHQRQSAHIARLPGHLPRGFNRLAKTPRAIAPALSLMARSGQHKMTGTLQLP